MSAVSEYVGTELEIFAHALNWKSYFGGMILPNLQGRVLEVGAGNGSNASLLVPRAKGVTSWTCLEPDSGLCETIRSRNLKSQSGKSIEVVRGTTEAVSSGEKFDAIIYIDVLEHIEHDSVELDRVSKMLNQGGILIVLSPAHQFLFSPFDAAIGHHRRYNKETLLSVVPKDLTRISLRYLDSFGLLASLGQRLLLKQRMPNQSQIFVWDRFLVPVSRILDPLTGYFVGKSLLGVWQRTKND